MNLRRAAPADLESLVALQHAAYAINRTLLGVEPIPLQADYRAIMTQMEVWLAADATDVHGALILEPNSDHLLIWSIATDPTRPPQGLGRDLLAFAERRARELNLSLLRLYTGTKLTHLVAWYGRHGYVVERIEERPDRSITHMRKEVL